MSSPLIVVTDKLAAALRNTRCTCVEIGAWPLFNSDAAGTPERPGRHTPKSCKRCVALAEYDKLKDVKPNG